MNSTRRRSSSATTKHARTTAVSVARGIQTALATGSNGGARTPAVFEVPAPHHRDVSDGIVVWDALERALRHVPRSAIGVVGSRADAMAGWLRRTGRDAARVTPQGPPAPVILAADFVESPTDGPELFGALKRMLTPDGLLIAVVPNLTHAHARIAMLLGRYTGRSNGSGPSFTLADVERLLDAAAFTIIDIERQVDGLEALRDMSDGVPESVVNMLANDLDAMTSHFVVLAEPHTSSSVGRCHRRVSEIAAAHRTTARGVERVEGRVAELEVRVQHWAAETDRIALRDAAQAAGGRAQQDDRIDREMRALTERLAADRALEAERDSVLNQARERLLQRTGEIKALGARIERARYRREILRIREVVSREVPHGSIVAVVSRGDDHLLTFDGRRGWHFPRTEKGVYVGHHPADSKVAIRHLEELRARGARYLVVPRSAFWWLDHYKEFSEHLERLGRCVWRDDRTCALFVLGKGRPAR